MRAWRLSIRIPRILLAIVLIIALSAGATGGQRLATAAGSFGPYVVNSTGDAPDQFHGDGICATAGGVCTLRAAIEEANAHSGSGPQTITFNIPGSGVQTISITSALPTLTVGNLIIDGYTQPGAVPNSDPAIDNAQIRVEVKGQGPSFDAFTLTSGFNTIRGLAIYDVFRPFYLSGPNASHNRLVGDYIGTNAAGTFSYNLPPGQGIYGAQGVSLYNGPSYNQIGDVAPADRNVISGNGFKGIALDNVPTGGPTTDHNIIYNNIIGLAPNGGPFPGESYNNGNPDHGIDMDHGFSYNIVGGTAPGQRNVIAGNGQNGIELSHPMSTTNNYGNQIIGNYIGTDVTGQNAYTYTAIYQNGINLQDGAISTTVAYNVVGNAGLDGITVYASTTDNTYANVIHDNRIGVSLSGAAIPVGDEGVLLGYLAQNETIGPNNIIANNSGGIDLCDNCGDQRDTFTQNSIYGNTGAGIYIGLGDNGGIKPPVLSGATPGQVTGTACAGCTVEVFKADALGQGQTYLATGMAGADGSFAIAITANGGDCLTATATDGAGDTSAFAGSACVVAPPTATPTDTPFPPTNTPTDTPIPPTNTPAATSTSTSRPTDTATATPTSTPTNTATATSTPAPIWKAQKSGTSATLRGLACPSTGTCLAVGDGGLILGTSNGGASWIAQGSGTSTWLKGIGCTSASVCIAVGDHGAILRTTNGGAAWASQTSPLTTTLYDAACPSTAVCYAVGLNGAILGTSNGGASWIAQSSGITATLYGIVCPTVRFCVAAGISGTILETTNGGATWVRATSATTQYLYGLTCVGSMACYAVGSSGAIVATTNGGAHWTLQSSGTTAFLRGIACTNAGTCYADGDGGVIVATANGGASWGTQTSGTTAGLKGMACAGGICYAVGDAGTILWSGGVIAGASRGRHLRRSKRHPAARMTGSGVGHSLFMLSVHQSIASF